MPISATALEKSAGCLSNLAEKLCGCNQLTRTETASKWSPVGMLKGYIHGVGGPNNYLFDLLSLRVLLACPCTGCIQGQAKINEAYPHKLVAA